jgi:hypothetical protein
LSCRMLLNQLQVQLVKGLQFFDLRKPQDSRPGIVRRQRQSAIRIRLDRQFLREPRRKLKIGSNLLRGVVTVMLDRGTLRILRFPLSLCFISLFGCPRYWWEFLVGKFAVSYRAFGYKPYRGPIGLADGSLEDLT